MCGIVGSLAKNTNGFSQKDCDTFTQMLYADAVRGHDATGVFGVNKEGNVDIKKMATSSGPFISTSNYNKFKEAAFQKYQMLVGHNRKATHGEKRHEDAHPFWDKEEKIVLIHNGMIRNFKEFCPDATVDSAAITNALAEGNVDDVISRIQGAYVFIWYNVEEKKLYFIRNADRPLFVSETPSSFHFASEDSLTYWVAKRNGIDITKTTELRPHWLYSFDLQSRTFKEEREITPKKQIFSVVTTTHGVVTTGNSVLIPLMSVPLTHFITEDDIPNAEALELLITPNSRISIYMSSYEKLGANTYKVTCDLINAAKDFIEISLYLTAEAFTAVDMCSVHTVLVTNIIIREGKCSIFAKDPIPVDSQVTKNDMVITEDMWYSKEFPCTCDICGNHMQWPQIPKSEILISKLTEYLLLCPNCT